MAPTIVSSGQTASWQTNANKSISVAVQVNDLLVVYANAENQTSFITISGGTGTWVNSVSIEGAGNYCNTYIWTKACTANETANINGTDGTTGHFGFGYVLFRNHGGLGASNSGNATNNSSNITLTGVSANSAIVLALGDWNAVAGTNTYITTDAGTFTELTDNHEVGIYASNGGYYADVGSAANKNVGLTAPTGMAWTLLAIEVKGTAAAGSASVSPSVSRSISPSSSVSRSISASRSLSPSGSISPSAPPSTALDDFNRGSIGTNWTLINGGMTISSNRLWLNSSDSIVYWNPNSFNDNQYCEAEQYGLNARGVIVRGQGTDSSNFRGYALIVNTAQTGSITFRFAYITGNGTIEYLDSGASGTSVTEGFKLRLIVSGQDTSIQLTAYIGGSQQGTLNWSSFTNKSRILNSGVPGLYSSFAGIVGQMDNFEAGTTSEPSASESPSPSAMPQGSIVWGHVTGVTETNIRKFSFNWSGTGMISGSGDSEKIILSSGQYMESEVCDTGSRLILLKQNFYVAGDTILLRYRQGNSPANCLAASWNNYVSAFASSGYVQIRVESTL